jgi:hypothetical protein
VVDTVGGIIISLLFLFWLPFFLFWFGFAFVVGQIAAKRGRDFASWFVLALLISPLLAGLIVVSSSDLKVEKARQQELAETKSCPRCAERVKSAANVCRFCGHEFVGQREMQSARRPISNILDPYELAASGETALRERLSQLSREQLNTIVADCEMDPNGWVPNWKTDDVIRFIVNFATQETGRQQST